MKRWLSRLGSLAAAALISSTALLHTAEESHAQVTDPTVYNALWNALGGRGAGAIPAQVDAAYTYVLNMIGRSARSLSHPRAINAFFEAELGGILLENTSVRNATLQVVQSLPADPEAARRMIASMADDGAAVLATAITNSTPDDWLEAALDAAYELTDDGAGQITTLMRAEAQAGVNAGIRGTMNRFLAGVGKAFGSFLELLSSHAVQRISGVYTIADFTQAQINEALFAYQDEMEAIGYAAEAEAFNNNLNLMLDSFEDGRTTLVPGMTLSEAIRQLRRNMNLGGSYFGNILVSTKEAPDNDAQEPACSCIVDVVDYEAGGGCSAYSEFSDALSTEHLVIHIVTDRMRHDGWTKPDGWGGAIGGVCEAILEERNAYCNNYCP